MNKKYQETQYTKILRTSAKLQNIKMNTKEIIIMLLGFSILIPGLLSVNILLVFIGSIIITFNRIVWMSIK